MPPGGRLETSSPFRGAIDRNEYLASTTHGLQKLELLTGKLASTPSEIQEYGVQSVFEFFELRRGAIQKAGRCVFVGNKDDYGTNLQDCKKWEAGQSQPPQFENPSTLHNPGDPAKE
jgi:hypothetical protein